PARLAWLARPRSRRISVARSASPSASIRARLQSIIPAPVASRSALTIAAVISVISGTVLRLRAGGGLVRRVCPADDGLVRFRDDLRLGHVRLEDGWRGDLL